MLIAATDALLRGPWLDEFWTVQLSDTRAGLAALIREGWLRDAHPPLFNALSTLVATLLSWLGFSSIPAGRLAANLPAVLLMLLAAWRVARRDPALAPFGAALLLLVLSLPDAMDVFATWRSYFWQVAAIASLALVGRHVVTAGRDLEWRRDLDLAAVAALASFVSIALHYVGGLFGGLLSVALAYAALARGHRRWAALLGTTALLGAAFIAASVALQLPNWTEQYDHSWIDTPILEASLVPLGLIAAAVLHNPVPLLALVPNFGFVFGTGGTTRRARPILQSDRRYAALIASVIWTGIAIVLVAHFFKPMVVDRYLIAVPVLVCALMAMPAARLASDRRLFALLAAVSVAVAALPLAQSGIKPLWNEGARTIRQIAAGCPSTRIYAASGWVPGPAAETRAAHREDPVFERAYRSLAATHGFRMDFLPLDGTAQAKPGACPVLLWFEHTPNEAENDLLFAIQEAGLKGLEGAQLSAIRSPTGFIVRADRDVSLSALP